MTTYFAAPKRSRNTANFMLVPLLCREYRAVALGSVLLFQDSISAKPENYKGHANAMAARAFHTFYEFELRFDITETF